MNKNSDWFNACVKYYLSLMYNLEPIDNSPKATIYYLEYETNKGKN